MNKPIIWITGLSGSGKTTLGKEISYQLREKGESVVFLDGDELRGLFLNNLGVEKSFDIDIRLALAKGYSKLCKLLSNQDLIVVISTISLFKEIHDWNRSNLEGYFEVYIKVPIQELKRRDPKQIYKRFEVGEIKNVAGLDLKIDEPEQAHFEVDFNPDKPVRVIANEILQQVLKEKRYG